MLTPFRSWLICALLLIPGLAAASPSPPLPEIVAQAAQTNQLVVVEFGATWCRPCREFLAGVLPHPSVQFALRQARFVSYETDVDAAAKQQADHYGIKNFPTFLIIDGTGAVKARLLGSQSIAEFRAWLVANNVPQLSDAELQALTQAKPPDAAASLELATRRYAQEQRSEALRELRRAVAAAGKAQDVADAAAWMLAAIEAQRAHQGKLVALAQRHAARFPDGATAVALREQLLFAPTLAPSAKRAVATAMLRAAGTDSTRLATLAKQLLAAKLADIALTAASQAAQLKSTGDHWALVAESHHALKQTPQALNALTQALAAETKADAKPLLETRRTRYTERGGEAPEIIALRQNFSDGVEAKLLELTQFQPSTEKALYTQQRERAVGLGTHLYKQACHSKAGKTDEVVVRLDGEPGKTPKVVVLLAAPNPALSQCLTDAAADIRLPFPRPNDHLTLVIPFVP